MQTLQEIRRRIDNAEDLQSLVRTMKAIAAVSVRQYERAVEALADYNRTTELGLQVVLHDRASHEALANLPPQQGITAVVFGTDQGLCGQFNEQIANYAVTRLTEMGIPPAAWRIVAIGARVAARLQDAGQTLDRTLRVPISLAGVTPAAQEILWSIRHPENDDEIDRVVLFYHRLISGATYQPTTVQLWPIDPRQFSSLEEATWPSRVIPTYSMAWKDLFSALLRQHLFVSLSRAFVESLASENAGRLAAMQVAERNIEDKLAELNALYHHRRQDGITSELLDIISGFEALTQG